jgi:hypothetical protein
MFAKDETPSALTISMLSKCSPSGAISIRTYNFVNYRFSIFKSQFSKIII